MTITRKEIRKARKMAKEHGRPVFVYSGALKARLAIRMGPLPLPRLYTAIVHPDGSVDR